jgi:hypothetical protein
VRPTRRVLVLLIAAAVVVAAGVGVFVAVTSHPLASVTLRTTDEAFTNPERGWYDAVDLVDPTAIAQAQRDGVTVVHSYLQLDDYRDAAIPQPFLAKLQQGFDALRAAHLKVVLRVAYNSAQGAPDATLARIEQHAAQLKPVLAKNADVVFAFEAGFIGAFGEWHDSTNGLDTEPAEAAVLRTVLAAFPRDRMVALRYPRDIRTLLPAQVTAKTAYGSTPQARIGNHQDCFLSSDPDDRGTWGVDGGSVAKDRALVASLGRYTVVGGETCGVSARTTCSTALHDLAEFHFSYLNRQFSPDALAKLQQGGCSAEIGRRLGYRLAVTRFEWSPQVAVKGTMQLRLTVENTGFAHVVNARTAYLVLTGSGGKRVDLPLRTDVRTWAAGATTTVDESVTLPPTVGKGTWRLHLWLPDQAKDLQDIPAYAIRLAEADSWEAATGLNSLHASVRVG